MGVAATTLLVTVATAVSGARDRAYEPRDGQGIGRKARNVIFFIGDGMGVSTVTATRDWQWIGGVRFTRHVAAADAPHPPHLWWSEDQLLARRMVATDPAGRTRTTVLDVRAGIDRTLIEPPASRFPAYRVVSVADWLEHR
jgi:hypothetical protein